MNVDTDKTMRNLLGKSPKMWLVTGAAGFIGSNLVEALLRLGQEVVGVDNFSTGHRRNILDVQMALNPDQWRRFRFIEGDITDPKTCVAAAEGVELVLHLAALASVPRSIGNPIATNAANVDGMLNVLFAAKQAGAKRVVYASSSSVYGDHPALPKREDQIGQLLSPYAVSKFAGELYASVFARTYGLEVIGLRYFNVFGRRQDPEGAYSAVIPRWIAAMIRGEPVDIFGDGETSRDFCYLDNVIQANLLSATVTDTSAVNQVYNIAVGGRTTLNELFQICKDRLQTQFPHLRTLQPVYKPIREGDVRHSQADISKAQALLGYKPSHTLAEGLGEAIAWYVANLAKPQDKAAHQG